MQPAEARFLASAEGARLLAAARSLRDQPVHRRAAALRGLADAERARWALRQDGLRARAAARIPAAERLLFEPDALEQASAWAVATERARRWPGPPDALLLDLGAGCGVDALAAAAAGRRVRAYERDPVRALLLAHNVRALGLEARVEVVADDLGRAPPAPLAFLDPDRRPGGSRRRRAAESDPPSAAWARILAPHGAAMVKAAPTDRTLGALGVPLEVVSLAGAARETRLYFGGWEARPPRRALALPSGLFVAGEGLPPPPPRAPEPGLWLLDPDPAVRHAGLVGDLAHQRGLAPLAPDLPYLLGASPPAGCPGHWLPIEACLAPRAVAAWLRAREVGAVEVRARGYPGRAEAFRRGLGLRGPHQATLVLTARAGRPLVLAGPLARTLE